jgi:hypothetical protein
MSKQRLPRKLKKAIKMKNKRFVKHLIETDKKSRKRPNLIMFEEVGDYVPRETL